MSTVQRLQSTISTLDIASAKYAAHRLPVPRKAPMADPNATGEPAQMRLGPSPWSGCPQQKAAIAPTPTTGTKQKMSASLPDARRQPATTPPLTPATADNR